MAKTPSDAQVLDRAERRSLILGYLTQHEGEHSVADIAATLKLRPNVVGKTLSDMAENGLVPPGRREGGFNYFHAGPVEEQPVKRTYNKRSKSDKAEAVKDIELVVGGTMIVIGRNANTGRIRIVLEDIA